MTEAAIKLKIKDNRAYVINKVNRARMAENWNAKLLYDSKVDSLIADIMTKNNVSELEASEILKQKAKSGEIK